MNNLDPISLLFGLAGGLVLGVLLNLLFNKFRSGSASPATIKKELEDYQQQVEAHFDETSDKFRAMAEQYKDLYEHLSVGATSLCRPEHVVPGLSDDSNPLEKLPNKANSPQRPTQETKTSAKTGGAEATAVGDVKESPAKQTKSTSSSDEGKKVSGAVEDSAKKSS